MQRRSTGWQRGTTMSKTLYLECYSGISGDMTVAALLDLGADREVLKESLKSLPVGGFRTEITRVKKSGLDACDFSVILEQDNHDHDMEYLHGSEKSYAGHHEHSHEVNHEHHHGHTHSHEHPHEHRGMKEITEIIQKSEMTARAKKMAMRVFGILAQAESKVRNEKKRAELEIRKAKKEVKDRMESMKSIEYFWGMGYITVILFAIIQNGAFQNDFIDFFSIPFTWYVRFCEWLIYPTYDNGFNQKIAYTGGEAWVIRFLAIVAVLFILVIVMVMIVETIKQYKKMWNEISQMFLIGSLSGIAVLGDVIRGYLPVNLILLFVFVNMGIMLLRMYLRKKLDYM